jgi:hypothetical protein
MKICTSCKAEKDLSLFYMRKGKPRSECKECTLAQNKGSINPEAKLKAQANYRYRNREELNRKHSDYKKANRPLCNAQWMKYHATKLNATPSWLTEEHHEQIKLIYAHAKECEVLTGDSYHVDHIVPLQGESVSGLHVPWNLQVLPADLNIAKSNKH